MPGVIQSAGGPRLAPEPVHDALRRHELRFDHLQRDGLAEHEVRHQVDRPHSATTDEDFDAVLAVERPPEKRVAVLRHSIGGKRSHKCRCGSRGWPDARARATGDHRARRG